MIPRRFFGHLARLAWPGPSIDLLLRAAALNDTAAAGSAWREFEAQADFDDLSWGQMRLISLTARRIAELAPDSPLRPRIAGIERSIWSRSRMVIGEAAKCLRALSDASTPMLAIKGAGRAAGGSAASRGRIVNDIDIVVPSAHLERVFDILVESGWTPSGSGSALYQRTRLNHVTGINFVRGELGNIDLHRTAFHAPFDRSAEDDAIWERARSGTLGGIPLLVPSPLDTVLIATAHGVLDAHKSSDWLVDIADAIDEGVDWEVFLRAAHARRLSAAAAVALGYVAERLERPVPVEVLDALATEALAHPLRLAGTIAEARPKSDRISFPWLARAASKQTRLIRSGRRERRKSSGLALASPFSPAWNEAGEATASGLEAELPLAGRSEGEAWSGTLDIVLVADIPAAARRIEFELHCGDRHLKRLRALVRDKGARRLPLRFRVRLDVPAGEPALRLVAVPSRSFNTTATPGERDRYAAVPFRLISAAPR